MRLLLLGRDQIGDTMAGPGIRYWELAHALADRHDVTLVAPNLTWKSATVTCVEQGRSSLSHLMRGQDAVITQWITPTALMALQRNDTRLVVDAYDPMMLEALEQNAAVESGLRVARARSLHGVQALALLAADAVLCASERQRDLWLGALMAIGRLTPEIYDEDSTLRNFVALAPFGCSSDQPVRSGPGPRELFDLKPDDVVCLWGGGIWDWFDPLVILHALDRIRHSHPHVKLVFMGVQHPAEGSTASGKAKATLALAQDLDLVDRSVFFSYGWIPYERRQSFLLDADAGVSAHLDHIETRFSFRTRVLDYLWAGLPCLLTDGDAMADLVSDNRAGSVIGFGDVDGWSRALARLADDGDERARQSAAAHSLAAAFTWPSIAARMETTLAALRPRAPRVVNGAELRELVRYVGQGTLAVAREGGIGGLARRALSGNIF